MNKQLKAAIDNRRVANYIITKDLGVMDVPGAVRVAQIHYYLCTCSQCGTEKKLTPRQLSCSLVRQSEYCLSCPPAVRRDARAKRRLLNKDKPKIVVSRAQQEDNAMWAMAVSGRW